MSMEIILAAVIVGGTGLWDFSLDWQGKNLQ